MINVAKAISPVLMLAAFCANCAAQECFIPHEAEMRIKDGALMYVDFSSYDNQSCLDLSGADVTSLKGVYDGDPESVSNISQIILPQGLAVIGGNAFDNIPVESIDIPSSVREIGVAAFMAGHMTYVNLPEGCEVVELGAFACNQITSFSWPTVELRGFSGFHGNKLASLKIPSNVKSLGRYAFADNPLQSVEFEEGIDTIGFGAFACEPNNAGYIAICDAESSAPTYTPLQSLSFPHSLKRIEPQAFYKARSLKTIDFAEGLISIGYEAFYYCDTLTSISFPYTLRSIGSNAFCNCVRVKHIDLNEGITSISANAFAACNIIGTLRIPGSLTAINSMAFQDAFERDTEVTVALGEGVTNIEERAFYVNLYSSNQPVTRLRLQFPHTLRSIGSNAFGGVWLPETELPLVAETGDSLSRDAYLDGALVEENVRTIGGLNKSGYTAFSRRSYVATVIPRQTSLPDVKMQQDVTIFDINGLKVYQGPKDSTPSLRGLFILRQPDGRTRLLKL